MLSLFADNSKAIRTLDFIALPELAEQLAVSGTDTDSDSTQTTSRTGTSGTGTTVDDE